MYLLLVILHVMLGFGVAYLPVVVSYAIVGIFALGVYDVIRTRDLNNRAGFYALYLMGMEVPYRLGRYLLAYEMGKYLCILILLTGVIMGMRKRVPLVFLFLFILLLPSIFLTHGADADEIRKDIMFNISGPLTLVISGLYFYDRFTLLEGQMKGFKYVFLPAITTIVGLSLKAGLGGIDFSSISSNAEASGGWGANQMSTALGWFLVLFFLMKFKGQKLLFFHWIDYAFMSLILIRGLLTFSRGGIMGALIAIIIAILVGFFFDQVFRKKIILNLPYVLFGIVVVFFAVLYANKLTNNFLLYRYMGLSTNEVVNDRRSESSNVLTGRDRIMEGDIAAFKDYPIFGVGYGMARSYHAKFYGTGAAAHTEYTRLLSENGVMGLVYNLLAFMILPAFFWFTNKSTDTRFFFAAFFFLSVMIMFHAAMRLALPGVLFGLSFMRYYDGGATIAVGEMKQ